MPILASVVTATIKLANLFRNFGKSTMAESRPSAERWICKEITRFRSLPSSENTFAGPALTIGVNGLAMALQRFKAANVVQTDGNAINVFVTYTASWQSVEVWLCKAISWLIKSASSFKKSESKWLKIVRRQVGLLRFGVVKVAVHDSRVMFCPS